MLDSSDSIIRNNLPEGEFKGPIHHLLSNKIVLQEGDNNQGGGSFNSFTVPEIPILLNTPPKNIGGKKPEFQSIYEGDDVDSLKNSKPQFLRLIIAKSLQNNFINNLWNRSYLRKLHHIKLNNQMIYNLNKMVFQILLILIKDHQFNPQLFGHQLMYSLLIVNSQQFGMFFKSLHIL